MEYATQYNIRRHSPTSKEKAGKAVQAVKRIHELDATSKRRARNKQRQEEVCAGTNAANGFLKSTFLPKMEILDKGLPAEADKIQADFYYSLSLVAKHYGFESADTRLFGYPYNIALSFWEIEEYLRHHVNDWSRLSLVQDDKRKVFFMTRVQYDTGRSLYYIPVIPLYKMLLNEDTKKAAMLLLSVFSYLYQVADIPYYRQGGTYLYWEHEMIFDWIEQDDESEFEDHKKALEIAEWCGNKMEQKICNPKNLEVFAARVKAFRPRNDIEQECLKVAQGIFSLYRDYPGTSIFDHTEHISDDEDQEEEVITMEKYISFISDNKGWLYETIAECVNDEFNECGEIEEPAIVKTFDGTTKTNCDLDFERRLFPLMGDLCYLLDND